MKPALIGSLTRFNVTYTMTLSKRTTVALVESSENRILALSFGAVHFAHGFIPTDFSDFHLACTLHNSL